VKIKTVIPRALANKDVEAAVDYYLKEQAPEAALGFVEALERGYAHIARHPASGALRYAHELDLPELRFWPLSRYPFLVFYREQQDHIDVWRVLHAQRDIPEKMRLAE
jgi:toxin ParE1/3/4